MGGVAPGRYARVASAIAGGLLAIAAWPLAFLLAVIAGGGHTSPFGHSPAEATFGAGLLGLPALLLLIGLALISGACTGRYRAAVVLTLLIPVDVAVTAVALREVNRPQPPVNIPPPDPKTVIRPAVILAVPACTHDHKCTQTPRPAPLGSAPITAGH